MITDDEVTRLRRLAGTEMPLSRVARRSGWSLGTVRKWVRDEPGRMPSMTQPRDYRTRADPFEGHWPEIAELLADAEIDAKTVFAELQDKHPGKFEPGQLRTLQRRSREWRALNGAEKEVFFQQVWKPGHQGQSDFTDMNELAITIRGEPFHHKCYHFVLPWSNWVMEELLLCVLEWDQEPVPSRAVVGRGNPAHVPCHAREPSRQFSQHQDPVRRIIR